MLKVQAGRNDEDSGLTPAIGYIRVSMAREEMISPELQRTAITDWAKRTGHRIIDWVEDLDKTGRNFRRRIMGVIERVERGEAQAIAVWKYSRFGRTREGVVVNLGRVERAGAQLLSATEGGDVVTATGRLQRGVIMEFNAFESDRAGEQWKETHQWRRDHGLPAMGKPRFGYIWHQRKLYQPDGTITIQEERYEPDEALAEIVKALYQRYIGGESFRALAFWLNDEGHRTVRGDLWRNKAVQRYMDSGFPAGYLRFHLKTCPIKHFPHDCAEYELVRHPTLHHPAIITDKVWKQYQERREFTRTAAPRARNAAYPLTGLVRCGLCNAGARRSADQRQYVAYACMGRVHKGPSACRGTSLSEPAVVAAVKDRLRKFAAEVDEDARAVGSAIPEQRRQDPAQRRLQEIETAIAKLEKAIAKHMRTYALTDDDDPDGHLEKAYLETLRGMRADKAALAEEQVRLKDTASAGGEGAVKDAALPVAIGLLEEWNTLEPARLNALLRRVVGRVELQGEKRAVVLMAWEV